MRQSEYTGFFQKTAGSTRPSGTYTILSVDIPPLPAACGHSSNSWAGASRSIGGGYRLSVFLRFASLITSLGWPRMSLSSSLRMISSL